LGSIDISLAEITPGNNSANRRRGGQKCSIICQNLYAVMTGPRTPQAHHSIKKDRTSTKRVCGSLAKFDKDSM